MKIEENFEKVEEIIRRMESGEQSLEDAFADYEAGLRLLKDSNDQIARVGQKIQILAEE